MDRENKTHNAPTCDEHTQKKAFAGIVAERDRFFSSKYHRRLPILDDAGTMTHFSKMDALVWRSPVHVLHIESLLARNACTTGVGATKAKKSFGSSNAPCFGVKRHHVRMQRHPLRLDGRAVGGPSWWRAHSCACQIPLCIDSLIVGSCPRIQSTKSSPVVHSVPSMFPTSSMISSMTSVTLPAHPRPVRE